MAEEKQIVIEGLEGNGFFDRIRKKFGIGSRSDKNNAAAVLFWLGAVVLAGLLIFTFTGANLDFNSDMATANILAEEIVRTHQYFPENWNAGQDLWVFFLHTFIVPLTLFSDNYLLMRSLATVIFIIMAVLTCVYCSRKVMKSNMWLAAIPLLFCGISPEYSSVVFGQAAYLPPMIYTLFFIALFVDCFDEKTLRVRSRGKYILLLVLTAFACLSGIRNMQVFGLPLVGAVAVYCYLSNYKKSVGELLSSSRFAILAVIGIVAAMAVGYIGFRYFASLENFSMKGASISFSDFDIFSRISTFVNLFIGLFGISYGVPLMSAAGIVNLIKICGGVLLLIVFPVLQLRDYGREEASVQIFSIFALLHLLEIFILSIFCVVLSDSSRYLFTSEFLLLFLSAHYIYKNFVRNSKSILRISAVLALCVYVLPASYPKLTAFVGYKDAAANARSLTDFLYDNGLTYGYATYWNASNNTCLSNGRVEINNVNIYDRVAPYYWLNSSDRYTANEGRSFLMLTEDENSVFLDSLSYEEFGQPAEILNFDRFTVYVYDYNIADNDFEGINTLEKEVNEYCSEYSTDAVYMFDSGEGKFVQFREHTLYTDAAMCPNGQIIVSKTDPAEAFPFIAEHIVLLGTNGDNSIYYSADSAVDCTSGLPHGDETVSRDYLYTDGVRNECEQTEDGFVTSSEHGMAFYGPYADTEEGTYRFTLSYDYIEDGDAGSRDVFDVCVDSGQNILGETELDPQLNEVSVTAELSEGQTFEYRLHHESDSRIRINYIQMEKAS